MPEDTVALGTAFAARVSRDAKSLAYDHERSSRELYLVSGLK